MILKSASDSYGSGKQYHTDNLLNGTINLRLSVLRKKARKDKVQCTTTELWWMSKKWGKTSASLQCWSKACGNQF